MLHNNAPGFVPTFSIRPVCPPKVCSTFNFFVEMDLMCGRETFNSNIILFTYRIPIINLMLRVGRYLTIPTYPISDNIKVPNLVY